MLMNYRISIYSYVCHISLLYLSHHDILGCGVEPAVMKGQGIDLSRMSLNGCLNFSCQSVPEQDSTFGVTGDDQICSQLQSDKHEE